MDTTAFRLRKPDAVNAFSLQERFVHLKDLGQAAKLEVGPDFWETIDQKAELQAGRLLGAYKLEKDMPHWEMHPAGDELVVALSGEFELVLQDGRTDHVVELKAGQAYLVPFGAWHRLKVKSAGDVLFVTPGKGTQLRAL
jgi:mannose-6-phosphate isomerase-like protein (cupin superfamily)